MQSSGQSRASLGEQFAPTTCGAVESFAARLRDARMFAVCLCRARAVVAAGSGLPDAIARACCTHSPTCRQLPC